MPDATPATSVLCKPAQSKCTRIFHKSHLGWKFTGKMLNANPATPVLCEPAHSKDASTCHKSRFVWKLTGTVPYANRHLFCASLRRRFRPYANPACAVEMHIDISQEPFCMEIYRENAKPLIRGPVRACAIKMHMDISWEPFCVEICGKMPDATDTTSIKHRALTLTVRTPQCGHAVWGKFLSQDIPLDLVNFRSVWRKWKEDCPNPNMGIPALVAQFKIPLARTTFLHYLKGTGSVSNQQGTVFSACADMRFLAKPDNNQELIMDDNNDKVFLRLQWCKPVFLWDSLKPSTLQHKN